ncbi:hypothetical protein GpSGHVEth125 [Glossina pallidipes salivary gland hypertrophy virus]|uniref:Uncharacterized protein n=1 Tax=Glossina hytrovirus (isolate Glossina pallidipes/Ethiopia/Seibersdorf/-) TaxID=379529 RepID=A0A109QR00_GHVS|nr:hypothetical protein GpSGHVEth125 [Glossina pallidipes salivary gland hypertrophy virus]
MDDDITDCEFDEDYAEDSTLNEVLNLIKSYTCVTQQIIKNISAFNSKLSTARKDLKYAPIISEDLNRINETNSYLLSTLTNKINQL